MQILNFNDLKNVMKIIEEEANKSNEDEKKRFKGEIMD